MQNYLPQPMRSTGYRVIPIANEFEMNSITVEFNGTPTYFHNQNTNEIYAKQFDIKTGLTTTQRFIRADNAQAPNSKDNTQPDTDLYTEKIDKLNERLDTLYEMFEDRKGKK